MESEVSELTSRHQYRVEREVQDLSRQVSFIAKRFSDAEDAKWQGTLKNRPLW